jgi:hypothetical protein
MTDLHANKNHKNCSDPQKGNQFKVRWRNFADIDASEEIEGIFEARERPIVRSSDGIDTEIAKWVGRK